MNTIHLSTPSSLSFLSSKKHRNAADVRLIKKRRSTLTGDFSDKNRLDSPRNEFITMQTNVKLYVQCLLSVQSSMHLRASMADKESMSTHNAQIMNNTGKNHFRDSFFLVSARFCVHSQKIIKLLFPSSWNRRILTPNWILKLLLFLTNIIEFNFTLLILSALHSRPVFIFVVFRLCHPQLRYTCARIVDELRLFRHIRTHSDNVYADSSRNRHK